jgi:Tol biopolymer transport system component
MTVRMVVALTLLSACTATEPPSPAPTPPGSAAAASGASPTAQAGPPIDVSALTGRVVVSDDTQDVWVMHADGSRAHRITHSRAQEFDPSWAPDRSGIVYRHQSGDDDTTEIFVMDGDGSHQRNLTRNHVADWGPDWSPNGGSIVWNSAVGTQDVAFFGYTMRPDGSRLRRLGRQYVEYPAWSPDGSQIAFMAQEPDASGSNPDYNIWVMDANGSNARRLTTTPGEDGFPAWSPDGSQIVFSSARDDCSESDAADCRTTGDIGPWLDGWIVNADGSDQRRLTAEFSQFFAWSPDGHEVMVAGASSMFVIRPDGSGLARVPVEGVPHPLFPDWTS